jgi:hypothetical protein
MRTLSAVAALLLLGSAVAADPTPDDVAKLIGQLGSPDFRTREAASKELDALGGPALPALKTAAASSTDAETARRASDLAARIARRLDNDKTLAPTLVELNFEDAALATVLAELQKQSGGRLAFHDLDALGAKVTVKTDGKVPFWDAVAEVCAAAKLELASPAVATSAPTPRSREAQLLAERQAAMADAMARQQAILRDRLKAAQAAAGKKAGAEEQKKLEELQQRQKREMEVVLAQLAQMQARQLALDRSARSASYPQPANTGIVSLRPKSETPNPSCVSGAVRVEAVPFPAAILATMPKDTVPVVLHASPEPRLKWERIEAVRITKATDDAGRELAADMDDAVPRSRVLPVQGGAVVLGARGGVNLVPSRGRELSHAFLPSATQSLVRLKAAGEPKVLRTLEGVVRATVRTAPEELATVSGLDKKEAASALAASGVAMAVTASERPGGDSFELQATLRYDPAAVQLSGQPIAERTVINQVGRGRVVVRGGAAVVNIGRTIGRSSTYGLVVTSADGKPFNLTVSASLRTVTSTGGDVTEVVKLLAWPTEKDQGAPAKVTLRGTRAKAVEVPFKLTDVPVAAGSAAVPDEPKKPSGR